MTTDELRTFLQNLKKPFIFLIFPNHLFICHVMRFREIVVIDFLHQIRYVIVVQLVFHLKEMTSNLFSICLSNSNPVVGYCVIIVLAHWANYAPTKS